MTYALIALNIVSVVGFLWLTNGIIKGHAAELRERDLRDAEARAEAAIERNNLMERIQRPEVRPAPAVDPNRPPAPEPHEPDIGLIGVVVPDVPEEPQSE